MAGQNKTWKERTDPYLAALILTLPAFTTIAAVGTVIAYVARISPRPPWNQWVNDLALLVGILSALVVWLIAALFSRRYTVAERANSRVYAEICVELSTLDAQLHTLLPGDAVEQLAYTEACEHRDAIRRKIGDTGLIWIRATGYVMLWNHVHRIGEALIEVQPKEEVVRGALMDELRLMGSNVDHRVELLDLLRSATTALSPSAKHYLSEQQSAKHPRYDEHEATTTRRTRLGTIWYEYPEPYPVYTDDAATDTTREEVERQARAVLRDVRRSINTFRDNRRNGLVMARNRLISTVTFAGFTTFGLFALAIVVGVPPHTIVAAAGFFLVGAVIGLFHRLYFEARTSSGVEDYGLWSARLIHTPGFSGLAAIGGVVLTALVSVSASTPATSTNPQRALQLAEIFNIETYPFHLIIAAIFGLTPSLLLNRIADQTRKLEDDLKNSQVPDAAADTPAT